jgi:hypothetical protein
VERLLRFGARLGGVGEHGQTAVGGEFHRFVGELEVADDRVVESFGAGVVEADVVGRPFGAERFALGGELADEICEVAVSGALSRKSVPIRASNRRSSSGEAHSVSRPARISPALRVRGDPLMDSASLT